MMGRMLSPISDRRYSTFGGITGTVLQSLVKGQAALNSNPNVTYQTAKRALLRQYQLAYLKPMSYQNGYGITVTQATAKKYHLVLLKDNKHFFPPYQGAPLMKRRFMTQHPQIVKSLKKLSGKISTSDMQNMNYQVTMQHKKAAMVAKAYLKAHHLLN